jgi:hypothetical protein
MAKRKYNTVVVGSSRPRKRKIKEAPEQNEDETRVKGNGSKPEGLGVENLLTMHRRKRDQGYETAFPPQTRWATIEVEYKEGGSAFRYWFMMINPPQNNNGKEGLIRKRLKPTAIKTTSIPINETLECRVIIADSETNVPAKDLVLGSSSKINDTCLESYDQMEKLVDYAKRYIQLQKSTVDKRTGTIKRRFGYTKRLY